MKRGDWLCLVAVHADCWLMATAYYNGAKLDQKGRQRLFDEINALPTCYEVRTWREAGSTAWACWGAASTPTVQLSPPACFWTRC